MKKFFVILFLFLPFNIVEARTSYYIPTTTTDQYISSDSCFTFSFWIDSTNDYYSVDTLGDVELLSLIGGDGISASLSFVRGEFYYENYYSFSIGGVTGSEMFYAWVTPGKHMFTVSYCNQNAVLYIDGVQVPMAAKQGTMPVSVSGYVTLSDLVVDGTFVYSSDVLSSSEVQKLYDFGTPGTIKYYINMLFWTVLQHFYTYL